MIGLKRTSQSNLDPNKITNQVRKSLRVLFPDSNSAGDYDVLVRQTGLLIAPRIGSSVAMTSDFYYKNAGCFGGSSLACCPVTTPIGHAIKKFTQ